MIGDRQGMVAGERSHHTLAPFFFAEAEQTVKGAAIRCRTDMVKGYRYATI